MSDRNGSEGAELCRAYMKNMCERGTRCKFYHPPGVHGAGTVMPYDRDRSPIRSSYASHSNDDGHRPGQVEFCIAYRTVQGCNRGDHCKYVHGSRDQYEDYKRTGRISPSLERSVAIVTGKMRPEGAPICMEYQRGHCVRGDKCRYQHREPERDPSLGMGGTTNFHGVSTPAFGGGSSNPYGSGSNAVELGPRRTLGATQQYEDIVHSQVLAIATGRASPTRAAASLAAAQSFAATIASTNVATYAKPTSLMDMERRVNELEAAVSELRRENDTLRAQAEERKRDYDALFTQYCHNQAKLAACKQEAC